jgi:hypothetical protein
MTVASFGTLILILLTLILNSFSLRSKKFIPSTKLPQLQHYNSELSAISGQKDLYGINDEIWKAKLQEIRGYIDNNNELPSKRDEDPAIRALGQWIETQRKNSKNKEFIMKDNIEIRNIWINFYEKYEKKIFSKEDIWRSKLLSVEIYLNSKKELPSPVDGNPDIKILGVWVRTQRHNYKNNLHVMKDNIEIRSDWISFIERCTALQTKIAKS